MKLVRTIPVTSEEFFAYINESILNGCNHATKKFNQSDIKEGFSYTIEDDKHTKTKITLLKYRPNSLYQSKIISTLDTHILTYTITTTDEGIEVTFEQDIESFNKLKDKSMNKKFQEAFYLGRMSDTLYDIQKEIIAKRNGEVITKEKPSNNLFTTIFKR